MSVTTAMNKQQLTDGWEKPFQRLAPYETRPTDSVWLEGVDFDNIYPQQCFEQAFNYTKAKCRWGLSHKYVIGECSLCFGQHAWVELPNGLVFDGVFQAFYKWEEYQKQMHARQLNVFDEQSAYMLACHYDCSPSRWWNKLGLPMLSDGEPQHVLTRDETWELIKTKKGIGTKKGSKVKVQPGN